MQLSAAAVRILGSLAEKEMTVPDTYPMTANALVVAANQSTNRFPVMELSLDDVNVAITELKTEHRLVRFLPSGAGNRVDKYRHVLEDRLGLTRPEKAVMAVLALRGPQTVAELRARTTRMHDFADQASLEQIIDRLCDPTQVSNQEDPTDSRPSGMLHMASTAGANTSLREGYARSWDGPLVIRLPRQPGQVEPRIMHLLSGEVDVSSLVLEGQAVSRTSSTGSAGSAVSSAVSDLTERVVSLEATVAGLQAELHQLRTELGA
jgi:uncharacterized protein